MIIPQLLIRYGTGTPFSLVYFLLSPPPPFPHLRFCNPFIGFFLPTSFNIFLYFIHVSRGSLLLLKYEIIEMIWTRERLEHVWFIPKDIWLIFDSKALVDLFHL